MEAYGAGPRNLSRWWHSSQKHVFGYGSCKIAQPYTRTITELIPIRQTSGSDTCLVSRGRQRKVHSANGRVWRLIGPCASEIRLLRTALGPTSLPIRASHPSNAIELSIPAASNATSMTNGYKRSRVTFMAAGSRANWWVLLKVRRAVGAGSGSRQMVCAKS